MADTPLQKEVLAADTSLKAIEARLDQARSTAEQVRSADRSLRIEAMVWAVNHRVRHFLAQQEWPRILFLALIPLPIAFLCFIVMAEITGVFGAGATCALLVFFAVMGVTIFFTLFPDDQFVSRERDRSEAQRVQRGLAVTATEGEVQRLSQDALAAAQRLAVARDAAAQEERVAAEHERQLREAERLRRQSVEYKRQRLFDRPWRAMRATEFENFLAEVLTALGYEVEQTGQSGDQGVDLIAAYSGCRIAIQAKGYTGSVSNSAVQEAFAGMAHYRCHGCAVITNSTFTPSAMTLAESTECLLVHEGNFREFVFGLLPLVIVTEQEQSSE